MDKKVLEKAKEELKESKRKSAEISKEEAEQVKELLEEAQSPTVFKNEDFKMAMGELDIRELNEGNFKQVLFRLVSMNLTYQRQIAQLIVDVERLLMILLTGKKVQPEEIANEINGLIEKLQETDKNKIN